MHSHDRHSRPRISKTLGKMLSRVYQIESLENRTLLSADPVGAVAIVLAPKSVSPRWSFSLHCLRVRTMRPRSRPGHPGKTTRLSLSQQLAN